MPTALNMTLKIKQDAETQAALQAMKANFATQIQPAIDQALRDSNLVHYARVIVIDDLYIQVITEFDGPGQDYTEFFRTKLQGVFKAIFSLADGVPDWDELNNPDTFYEVSGKANLPSLGAPPRGYLFAAYGDATVREINAALHPDAGSGSGTTAA